MATVILFESNGGQSQSKAEAAVPEIKVAVGGPDANLAEVEQVLEGLVSTCFYLSWDRNRYRVGLHPNLNQMLVARKGAVQPPAVRDRVKKEIEALFREGPKGLDRRFFPAKTGDVPDRPELTLVVLGAETPHGDPAAGRLVESVVRD